MKIARCKLKSVSPLQQSRYHTPEFPKEATETSEDHELRTWKERAHYNKDGYLFLPPMMFANCVKEGAKYLSIQIPGKAKQTYTKHFDAGLMVVEPLVTNITRETVKGLWVHVPSDGKRGGTNRVLKCFPTVIEWAGVVEFVILDETITLEIFERVLKASGSFIGLGVFRPRNRGYYGRFEVEKIEWVDA